MGSERNIGQFEYAPVVLTPCSAAPLLCIQAPERLRDRLARIIFQPESGLVQPASVGVRVCAMVDFFRRVLDKENDENENSHLVGFRQEVSECRKEQFLAENSLEHQPIGEGAVVV
jgi:hypothetical protein